MAPAVSDQERKPMVKADAVTVCAPLGSDQDGLFILRTIDGKMIVSHSEAILRHLLGRSAPG